jgi:hypothetical protein
LGLGFWKIIKRLSWLGLSNLNKNSLNYLENHFAEFSMILFMIIYGIYALRSNLNIGIRHILPIMPFVYILITIGLKTTYIYMKNILIFILVAWYFLETLFASPYFLSYFNELGGGVKNGYNYAVASNYDWGQDLKRLSQWVKSNNIQKVTVNYFGTGDVEYYLKDKAESWDSGKGNPKERGINWSAVSVDSLKTYPEQYLWLQKIKDIDQPDYRAGTSIFIYKL